MRIVNKIINLLSRHKSALILSVIVGLCSLWPTVSSVFDIGLDNFKGIYPVFVKDADYYATRANVVASGFPKLGNAYIFEHKNDNSFQPPLAENFFAFLSKISRLNLSKIFLINGFLLPVISFLLMYSVFFSVSRSRLISNIFSLFLFFLFFTNFLRYINPQFSFVPFVFGVWLIWTIFVNENDSSKKTILLNSLLGLVFVSLFYMYLFFWSALILLYVIVLIFKAYLGKNIKIIWKNCRSFVLIVGVGVIPFLLNLKKTVFTQEFKDATGRFGMIYNHWPASYVNAGLAILAFVILIVSKKSINNKKHFVFSLALLVAILGLNWQNVITGKYLFFSSHYSQVTFFFVLIVISIILSNLLKEWKKKIIILFFVFIFLSLVLFLRKGEIFRFFELRTDSASMTEMQQMSKVVNWFNKNTAKNSVIYNLINKHSHIFPMYTHNSFYYWGTAGCFLMTDDEIEERWVRQNIFNDKIDYDFVEKNQNSIWLFKYISDYQNKEIRRKLWRTISGYDLPKAELIPESVINRVLEKDKKARQMGIEKALKTYKIDYILINSSADNFEEVKKKIDELDFIKLEIEIDGNYIYKII